ncbi:hypothetical protein ACE38W_20230 [Chitinophaga sp. Hz27]|uniref:hypothetical protein n=1 Tax=Chitinophaga sp. Hz27 TaxID=3347169 RepID=UPI0035D87718
MGLSHILSRSTIQNRFIHLKSAIGGLFYSIIPVVPMQSKQEQTIFNDEVLYDEKTRPLQYPNIKQLWILPLVYFGAALVAFTPLVIAMITSKKNIAQMPDALASYQWPCNIVFFLLFNGFVYWKHRQSTPAPRLFGFTKINISLATGIFIASIYLACAVDGTLNFLRLDRNTESYDLFQPTTNTIWMVLSSAVDIACTVFITVGILMDGLLKNYKPSKAIFLGALLLSIGAVLPSAVIPAFIWTATCGLLYYYLESMTYPIVFCIATYFVAIVFPEIKRSWPQLHFMGDQKPINILFCLLGAALFAIPVIRRASAIKKGKAA